MQSAKFEKLEDGAILVTCNEVADHEDHVTSLQELCGSLESATVGLVDAKMLNDSELQFQIKIVPNVPTNMEEELEKVVKEQKNRARGN